MEPAACRIDKQAASCPHEVHVIEFFEEVVRRTELGERVAIATLVSRLGSAPGALGAKMLIRGDGTTLGTIGGGCVEADVWQAGVSAQKSGGPVLLSFHLSASEAAEGGLICGGKVEILVEPVLEGQLPLYRSLSEVLRARGRALLGTVIPESSDDSDDAPGPAEPSAQAVGEKGLWIAGGETLGELPAFIPADDIRSVLEESAHSGVQIMRPAIRGHSAKVALEFFAPMSTVYVFGAGHISREIASLAKHVGFRVVVLDDRAFFLDREAFPDADELIAADFEDVVDKLPIDRDSYLVIVTRGHQHDAVVLEQALRTKPRYVGMIGSRTKVASIKAALKDAGIAQEKLDAVHAPIGIPIAARSPEEIAVSIVAELINVRGTSAPD